MSEIEERKTVILKFPDTGPEPEMRIIPGGDEKKKECVLITSMNFPSGGAGATYLNLFCRGLKQSGIDIRVLLLKGYGFGNYSYKGSRKNITSEGIPYEYLGFTQRPDKTLMKILEEIKSSIFLIFSLFSMLGKRKSLTVLLYNSEVHFNLPIIFFTRIFGIRTVKFVSEFVDKSEFTSSFFGDMKRYGYYFNFRFLNRFSDKLIVFSYYLKEKYLSIGFDEKKIYVQPNLTDFDFWKNNGNEIKYTLGYSGAPYLKDGLQDLFKAISILDKEDVYVTLLVIGDAVFGKSLIPGLMDECKKLGISDRVYFTGLVESSMVKKYLSECRILTLTRPSTVQTKAGFPTKLGEYFATEKPILTTNFGDMERYFTNGSDLIMANCGDPASIAEKIKWMLLNEDKLRQISQDGYSRAQQVLEYRNSVKRMLEFLNLR